MEPSGPVMVVVTSTVTGPDGVSLLVSPTAAQLPPATRNAAAAAPKISGGRRYQGTGATSGRLSSSSWAKSITGLAVVSPYGAASA